MCGITSKIIIALPGHNGHGPDENQSHASQSERSAQVEYDRSAEATLRGQLNDSLDIIAHRGPDAKGVWLSDDGKIGLGHCRLSINDLSADADQPIHSDDGRIHAVVNGEIYDHDRIREELQRDYGYRFKSRSDSEVVVGLYQVYGAPDFLEHLNGEFAFVIYDERSDAVIAARDRFGIKPLFWTVTDDDGQDQDRRSLLIASEAKAFLPLGWEPEWDVASIIDADWYVADKTLFRGVKSARPGHWMELSLGDGQIAHHRYWEPEYRGKTTVETRTVDEMVLGVRERLTEAIRLRLRADVPIGIYLSGGIDSSLIAGIVTKLVREQGVKMGSQDATDRIRCFSIEFEPESGFDESDIAQRTADWLGVQILKKRMDEATLAGNFADSVWHCEHHNLDLNSVGKHVLSSLPQEYGFKVVLAGEGADEHFLGYWLFLPDLLEEPDLSMPDAPLTRDDELRARFKSRVLQNYRETKARVGAFEHGLKGCPNPIMSWQPRPWVFAPWVREKWDGVNCGNTLTNALSAEVREKMLHTWHPISTAQYMWIQSIFPNNILSCLGDRVEMAHGIESRVPFLDHNLAEYVNGLPPSLKMAYTPENKASGGRSVYFSSIEGGNVLSEKWILREAGKPFLTEEIYNRRKHPYSAPVKWPRGGPMHLTLGGLLTREKVENLGFVDYGVVENALQRAFGEDAETRAFRILLLVAAWVVMGERFGIKEARLEDWSLESPMSYHERNGHVLAKV